MNLNPLPPSLRKRKRYVVFDIISENPKKLHDVRIAIWTSMLNFLGENETSKANLWLISSLFNYELQKAAIKVNHDMVGKVRAALTLIKEINGDRTTLTVVGVAGTMEGVKKKYFE